MYIFEKNKCFGFIHWINYQFGDLYTQLLNIRNAHMDDTFILNTVHRNVFNYGRKTQQKSYTHFIIQNKWIVIVG